MSTFNDIKKGYQLIIKSCEQDNIRNEYIIIDGLSKEDAKFYNELAYRFSGNMGGKLYESSRLRELILLMYNNNRDISDDLLYKSCNVAQNGSDLDVYKFICSVIGNSISPLNIKEKSPFFCKQVVECEGYLFIDVVKNITESLSNRPNK